MLWLLYKQAGAPEQLEYEPQKMQKMAYISELLPQYRGTDATGGWILYDIYVLFVLLQ